MLMSLYYFDNNFNAILQIYIITNLHFSCTEIAEMSPELSRVAL